MISNTLNSGKCKLIYGDGKEISGCLVGEGMAGGRITERNKGTFDMMDLLTTLIVVRGPQENSCVQTYQNLPHCTLKYVSFIVYQLYLIS